MGRWRVQRELKITEKRSSAALQRGNPASMVAGFIDGKSSDLILEKARARVRAFSWYHLEFEVLSGESLRNNSGSAVLE